MLGRVVRLTLAVGLALGLGLAFTPLGCGGSQQGVDASSHGGDGPGIPEATVLALKACASQGRARLKETTYAFQFAVEVTEDGHAGRVRLKDSSPSDAGMEECMARALEDMPVPPSVVQALSQQAEQVEAVSPASRGLMGNPFLAMLGGAVELGTIVLTAAGVTVVVGVSIYAAEEIVEAVKRRRKSRAQCYAACDAAAEVCEESCRMSTKPGTVERQLCWSACNEGNGQCKRKC